MELKAKEFYCNQFCTLKPGMDTYGYEIPAEVKAQMLADFPSVFEVVEGDDTVQVENQEDKMPKMRKK